MKPPLSWTRQGDIDVLLMGEIEVGRAMMNGAKGARYIFNLLGSRAFWKDEKTLDHAKLALTIALNDWLRKAGLA
jgi:hypothetical protein